MSCRASNNGLKYGSIFSCKVPGRKPNLSPASTAGLVKIILFTCFDCSDWIAFAIARYVFPQPAGPIPKVIVFVSIASTYFFWFEVLGRIVFPLLLRILRDKTSAGCSVGFWFTIPTERLTMSAVKFWPERNKAINSSISPVNTLALSSSPLT